MALQGALRQITPDRRVAPYFLRTVRPWLGALAPEAFLDDLHRRVDDHCAGRPLTHDATMLVIERIAPRHGGGNGPRKEVARVPGFEPGAYRLGGGRSIQLSYTRTWGECVV